MENSSEWDSIKTTTICEDSRGTREDTTRIFILDWDDTLSATTHGYRQGYYKNIRENSSEDIGLGYAVAGQDSINMGILDHTIVKLLVGLIDLGVHLHIVTNAEKGWVELSSKNFLPLTHKVIKSQDIPVISARAQYGEVYRNDPVSWKFHTIKSIVFSFINSGADSVQLEDSDLEIISVGDSHIDRDAVRKVVKHFDDNLAVKTIKFMHQPSIENLIYQLKHVLTCIKNITFHQGDLDLKTVKIFSPIQPVKNILPVCLVPTLPLPGVF